MPTLLSVREEGNSIQAFDTFKKPFTALQKLEFLHQ